MRPRHKSSYWSKERIENGLRRYARDFFAGREPFLPQHYHTYLEMIPADERRNSRHLRLYPPAARVLQCYESFAAAWEHLGFALDYRSREYWTRDEVIRGLKRFHADFHRCPTDYRQYHEKAKFQGRFDRHGNAVANGSYNKYPSMPTVLKFFRSMRNAWTSAGFNVDQRQEPWLPEEDEFILESAGILPRAEVAELLKRTVPAVKRRLYDLGRVNSKNRWGITVYRAKELLGASRRMLDKYLACGIIPYFRGHRYIYLNPADLLLIEEFDWQRLDDGSEVARLLKSALVQRAVGILKHGARWREREIYRFHKEKDFGQYRHRQPQNVSDLPATAAVRLPPAPHAAREGERVRMTKRWRMIAEGRQGTIKAVIYTPPNQAGARGAGGWKAHIEFPKMKRLLLPERTEIVPYTVPFEFFEKIEVPPPAPPAPRSPEKAIKKVHFEKNGQAVCRQNSTTNRFSLATTTQAAAVTCRVCLDVLTGKMNLCRFRSRSELPATAFCLQCETEKPIREMMVAFLKKEKLFRIRPRCKACYNESERGHRRAYKREYQQQWRENNSELNESYWKDNPAAKERARINGYQRFAENHDALLIQGRMQRKKCPVSIREAENLLARFGRCYPTPQGLTEEGLRECEKIRSRFRARHEARPSNFNIRRMVYEDDRGSFIFVIRPEEQPAPYQNASEKLKNWHTQEKSRRSAAAEQR